MIRVNVGVMGVGNCASSLVQGLEYYGHTASAADGLTNVVCAGYAVANVRITSAVDINTSKIDRDLSEAIWAAPNNALKFADVPHLGVPVREGILSDGVGHHSADRIDARGRATRDDIVGYLKDTDTHVVVNFLPVGSQDASELYAEAALGAGCGFINCIPSVIARSADWSHRFEEVGLPLLGDDLKSQFGATLVHHALVDVLSRNGVQLRNTYQIVSGGNMDFLNMEDSERVKSKKTSKVQGFGGAIGGMGLVNLGGVPPGQLFILRKTPCNGQITIAVDLNRAVRSPDHRPLVQPGDILILRYKPQEEIVNFSLVAFFTFGIAELFR